MLCSVAQCIGELPSQGPRWVACGPEIMTPSSPGRALNGLGWSSLLRLPNVPWQYSLLVCHHVWKIGKHQRMEEYGLLSEVDHSLDSVSSVSWLGNLVHGSNLVYGSYLSLA